MSKGNLILTIGLCIGLVIAVLAGAVWLGDVEMRFLVRLVGT